MKLTVTGLNHRTAPVEVRERLAFDAAALPAALKALRSRDGVQEALILSTCNRVEVAAASEDHADMRTIVAEFFAASRRVAPDLVQPHLYHHENREAVRHMFRVAASLDSMVVGEPQILGQMKAAYAAAKAHGTLGGPLETALTAAFRVAKRVRSETGIGRSAVSVSFAAVELAREIFGSLAGKKVLLIGAGKMSELAARYLHRSGASQIFVTNRTEDRAVELARLFGGSTIPYHAFLSRLPEIDILIASSGAPHYLLRKEDMRRVIEARRNRPVFLIDIAVPRNIDPAINELDHVFLYDIDDLERVVEANRRERLKEAEQAEEIIAQEVDRLLERLKAREVAPTIVSLQQQLEQWRQAELERVRSKLGTLTPQQQEAIEALTRGLINKIAHAPISELRRQAGTPDGMQTVELIRRLFRLDE
ncbi:MAG: glutamyl-tRNA reductase [Bryobacterales bacterium]|nr:glutamyl-tRNA reductase [Bryobacteraceae bacterium]MDW8355192.1 glutamyl-tRNA reductase [Bryobacterales bacterium]